MRQCADNLHRLRGGQEPITTQHRTQQLGALSRPARQVGERAVLGLAVLAEALAQQDGGRRAAVRYHRNIHALTESGRFAPCQDKSRGYMTARTADVRSLSATYQINWAKFGLSLLPEMRLELALRY